MGSNTHLQIKVAAELEGVKYTSYLKRVQRENVILAPDPEDARRKLVPITALSPSAYSRYLRDQAALAIVPPAPSSAPLLPFRPTTKAEGELVGAAPVGIPKRLEKFVRIVSVVVGKCVNGSYKTQMGNTVHGILIKNKTSFTRATAKENGVSPAFVFEKVRVYKEVWHDSSVPPENKFSEFWTRVMPRLRPPESWRSYFTDPENSWALAQLHAFYFNQAKLSVKRAHELLCMEIDAKQKAWGAGHLYQKPTLKQCRTALEKVDRPTATLGREGEKAYNDRCAPYISRRPPEESGAVVCTDGKLLDILCRDAGWRLGRIWWVPFADVASERWLGHSFGPRISGDMVMDAAARMLESACVPGAVQIDRGKEFQGQTFTGGYFKTSGENVFEEMEGLWERLGVSIVSAIGRNPKTKPVERLFRSVREFEQSFSTYTGPNPHERPAQLALIEKQVKEFKAGKAPAPPVPTIEQVIAGLVWWCEHRWNAQHRGRGKYRRGLTPDEAWNVKRPDGGHRTLGREEIDYYTSERRFVKVARGGQVNLTLYGQTLEYAAPELFFEQGKPVEVLRSRLDANQVTVIYPIAGGTASCVAHVKGELPWGSESRREVAVRLRCINSLKRTMKRSMATAAAATRLLPEAPYLSSEALLGKMAESNLVNARQLFGTSAGAPGPRPEQEISSGEWDAMKHGRTVRSAPRMPTAEELAKDFLEDKA
jgi:hypothetical protein